ncbi:hypothetical protein FRC12_023624 [Ceratobasidium sp. 428]|nr:hypothetical protein FRC12_023624 [Ceratobasidium sp. 428]
MHWTRLSLVAPALLSSTYALSNSWTFKEVGTSGVNAMQLAVLDPGNVIFIDKLESNPLRTGTGNHAMGAIYELKTNKIYSLDGIKTNSFCAGGGFLSNGTMVNIGGNPMYESGGTTADDGLQGIRLVHPCESKKCEVYENPDRLRLASPRWYPSTCRLQDGSMMIMGGSIAGDWTNNPGINTPSCEFFPPKDKVMYDWKTNQETRLPNLPNGQRCTYPYSGTATLLPLNKENGYASEVLVCGGSHASNETPQGLSTQTPASSQCSRMVLTTEVIAKGWQVETMPVPRTMHSSILMPDGRILMINGAQTGTAGYGNVPDTIGQSNADNPAFQPVWYDPNAATGQRFSTEGLPASTIPRMYHSTVSLLSDGSVIIAGSNPNLDVSTQKYPTEYRVEVFSPFFILDKLRPVLTVLDPILDYKNTMKALLKIPGLRTRSLTDPPSISVVIMDLGFSTHGVHMDQRMVSLDFKLQMLGKVGEPMLTITGPPNADIYPPGPAYIAVLVNKVVSPMCKILIGDGKGPPVNQGAIDNMLAHKPGQS